MKILFRIFLLIAALLAITLGVVFSTLKHKKLETPKNEISTVYEPEVTTLNFPLYISVHDLELLINKKVRKALVNKKVALEGKHDTLVLNVIRQGNIQVAMEEDHFNTSVPLHIQLQYIKRIVGKTGVMLFKKHPLEIFLTANFRSSIDLQENLKLNSETTLTSIQWKKEPVLEVAGFKINLKEKIQEVIGEKTDTLTGKIDEVIHDKVNLRKPVRKIWNKLQNCIQTSKKIQDKDQQLYLRTQPQTLSVYVDKSLNDSLKLDLTITSRIYVRFAEDTASVPKTMLPHKIKVIRQPANDTISSLFLHLLLPLHKLNDIAREKVVGKEIKVGQFSTRITSLEVTNGKKNIFVKIKHAGGLKGELVLRGIPRLSEDKQTLYIHNLGFENKSKDEVYTSVSDLLHDKVIDLVEQYLKFEIGDAVNAIPHKAQKSLDKTKVGKRTEIQLYDVNLEDLGIFLTKNDIQLIISGESSFEIALKKESFKQLRKPSER